MKKKCSICSLEKEVEFFSKNNTKFDKLASHCKLCANDLAKKHYIKNKTKMKQQILVAKQKRTSENRKKMVEYYLQNPCVDCGEDDPIVLEFDHVRGEKFKEVGRLLAGCWSWETILKEIKKCDVRCANCHRRKTAKEQGWYMVKIQDMN